jgi:hypothetical protein
VDYRNATASPHAGRLIGHLLRKDWLLRLAVGTHYARPGCMSNVAMLHNDTSKFLFSFYQTAQPLDSIGDNSLIHNYMMLNFRFNTEFSASGPATPLCCLSFALYFLCGNSNLGFSNRRHTYTTVCIILSCHIYPS